MERIPSNRILPFALRRLAWESQSSGITDMSCGMLFAQHHAQEAIADRQRAIARIVDKAHRPELVHEMTDPRPRSTDHLCQVFPIDSGMDRFASAFLAKMRQQQENSGQAFLAGVEQMVYQILFKANVARKQVRHEQFRDSVLLMQQP